MRDVAVKVMALSHETAEEVRKEIVLMRGCTCPHIVAYLDAFTKPHDGMQNKLWVVMEWCELGSAHDLIRRRDAPLDEASAAWVVRGTLLALQYMHEERKAIHRDIKAANVLLSRDGHVKLADLGVAGQVRLPLPPGAYPPPLPPGAHASPSASRRSCTTRCRSAAR